MFQAGRKVFNIRDFIEDTLEPQDNGVTSVFEIFMQVVTHRSNHLPTLAPYAHCEGAYQNYEPPPAPPYIELQLLMHPRAAKLTKVVLTFCLKAWITE